MDDLEPAKSSRDSNKVTIAILVSMAVVLIVAGIGIATVRDASETIKKATATTTTVVPGGVTAVPPASQLTPEQAQAVEEVKGQVAAIRGLAWKATLPVRFLTKEQLGQHIRTVTATSRLKRGDQAVTDESILKLLGLIGKNVDFAKSLDNLLAGGVIGYYDDEGKELFVGGSTTGPLDPVTRATLAHELTHALTDQHFDFSGRISKLDDENRTEEAFAFVSVREGDAELVRDLWQEKHLSERERREAASAGTADAGAAYLSAPPYLLSSVLFPYQDGLTFVRSRHRAGGFAEVDNAYRKPPTSTEHILHPETYASGQTWTAPALPDLAAATGCGQVDTGTLGEFDMSQVLTRQLTPTDARSSAAGWNGDAYGVVRCGAALALADRWQADDPADAGRLADALARWAKGWSGSTRATDAEGRFSGPSGSGRVVRTGSRVDLVLADDAATADRVGRALLGS